MSVRIKIQNYLRIRITQSETWTTERSTVVKLHVTTRPICLSLTLPAIWNFVQTTSLKGTPLPYKVCECFIACQRSVLVHTSPVNLRHFWVTDWLTASMEQSPSWRTNNHSVKRSPKVHHSVHNSPSLVPSQMQTVHNFSPLSLRYIILLPTPRYSKWLPPFWFSDENVVYNSDRYHACYMPHSSSLIWSP
jgi:hypothetical protein